VLVDGLAIPADGIDRDGPEVAAFRAWVANQSAQSPDTEYVCGPHDAAVILEWVAGWHGGPLN
jgi:hypothetical protein